MGRNRNRKNCVSRSCHRKSAKKCSNFMCKDHCLNDGFRTCDLHAEVKQENEDVGVKLRISLEVENENDEQVHVNPITETEIWSPPCLRCGLNTNINCSNALCDDHCLHFGKSECKYHENLNTTQKQDIWESARTGNIEQLREWIEDKKMDVNIIDTFRNSPLFYSCWGGQKNTVQYLLRNGAKDDPVLKRCWWNTIDTEIRSLLEEHYEEQYCEKQVTRNQLEDLPLEERENILLQPLVRYLHMVRKKGFPPIPGTERFEIEQLIPDQVLKDAFEKIPTYDFKTDSLEVVKKEEKETEIDEFEDIAFQSALSSLNNLRGSMNIVKDSDTQVASSKLEKEAAKLCAHSLEELLDMNSCKICFARMVDCVLIPCGHLGFCMGCIKDITECPTCTREIEKKLKLYRV